MNVSSNFYTPRATLLSQALWFRWRILDDTRIGDVPQAKQRFVSLQCVVAYLQTCADHTPDDLQLVNLCIHEADRAIRTVHHAGGR